MATATGTGSYLRRVWAVVAGVVSALLLVIGAVKNFKEISEFSCRFVSEQPYCKKIAAEKSGGPGARERLALRLVNGEITREQAEAIAAVLNEILPGQGTGSEADRKAAALLVNSSDPAVRGALAAMLKGAPDAAAQLDAAVRAQKDAAADSAFGQLAYPLQSAGGAPSPLVQVEAAMQAAERATMTLVDLAGAPLPEGRATDGAYFRVSVQTPVAGKALLLERTVAGKVVILSPRPEVSPPGGDRLKKGGRNRFPTASDFSFKAEVVAPGVAERGRYLLVVAPDALNVEAMREMLTDPPGDDPDTATFAGLQRLAAYLLQEVPTAPQKWSVSTLDYEFVKAN